MRSSDRYVVPETQGPFGPSGNQTVEVYFKIGIRGKNWHRLNQTKIYTEFSFVLGVQQLLERRHEHHSVIEQDICVKWTRL